MSGERCRDLGRRGLTPVVPMLRESVGVRLSRDGEPSHKPVPESLSGPYFAGGVCLSKRSRMVVKRALALRSTPAVTLSGLVAHCVTSRLATSAFHPSGSSTPSRPAADLI